MQEKNFYAVEFDELVPHAANWLKISEKQSGIVLFGCLNEYHSDEVWPILVSPVEYAKAVEDYLKHKSEYYTRYESSEVGVGFISFVETESFYETETEGGLIQIPLCTFEYVQMERG